MGRNMSLAARLQRKSGSLRKCASLARRDIKGADLVETIQTTRHDLKTATDAAVIEPISAFWIDG